MVVDQLIILAGNFLASALILTIDNRYPGLPAFSIISNDLVELFQKTVPAVIPGLLSIMPVYYNL